MLNRAVPGLDWNESGKKGNGNNSSRQTKNEEKERAEDGIGSTTPKDG
jgi:hypothetical protein